MKFAIASSLDEALQLVADGARPIAGGTDLVVGARHGKAPFPASVVAIDRLSELRKVETTGGDTTVIGALVSHAMLMSDSAIVARHTGLADASALVGSPATRHVGTLGGNVMNASPAMDAGAPLLTMNAVVELRSTAGVRFVPIGQLWTGPGATSADRTELCVAIHVPIVEGSGSAYVRLEYRRAMEIAVVGASATVALDTSGNLSSIDVALTAVAPTIISVDGLEILLGSAPGEEFFGAVAEAASARATPISDLRASDTYRRHTVGVMARRAVEAAVRRASGEIISVPVNRAIGIGAAS